jgi:iron complex transport system ATP-binding protein
MILSIQGLYFSYNGRRVLRDVSFQLKAGQILAILGVNGAGKTTLLKCINRVLRPASGSVFVDGRDVGLMRGREIACSIGYVPQRYAEEDLSVFDTVLLGRKPYLQWRATRSDIQIVESLLIQLGLEPLAMRPVKLLSGGEIQKVILARALAQEPSLLLLDEPTSNLDLKNQLEVVSIIQKAVRTQGISAIFAVHDINLALRCADRIMLLKDGRVHLEGDPAALTPEILREVYGIHSVIGEVHGHRVMVATEIEDSFLPCS